jgi:lipoprotein-releasing system permease protein
MSKPLKATPPFAGFEWLLALRYVRTRRAERFVSVISIISLIGIALGVATLIIVLSVMNAFRTELTSRILGINGHMRVEAIGDSGLSDFAALASRLRAIPGIVRVTPLVEGQVLASQNNVSVAVNIRGIFNGDLEALTALSSKLSPGALARFGRPDTVIVGMNLAQRLGLDVGQQLVLTAPDPNQGVEAAPIARAFTVAGTFRVGATQYDRDVVFMPFDQAQAYFGYENRASALEIMLTDPQRAAELKPAVQKAAGAKTRVLTWQEMNSTIFSALRVERNVTALILTLMIFVAAMNLVSSFIMLVKDKGSDIAILRSMGATRGTIMRVFFIAGAGIGVIGTLAGFLVGFLVCQHFEIFRPLLASLYIKPLLNPYEVTFVVVVALVLSFLATLIPSWRAARLDPVEALRYE